MDQLIMEVRRADTLERTITGVVAPYDEVSYLTPNPGGERVIRGAFTRSLRGRESKVPLFRNHDHTYVMGRSIAFTESPSGLTGRFRINTGRLGDELFKEVRDGYLPGLSVGFRPLDARRGTDGVREVRDADLIEVSMVGVPAYSGAELISVRRAYERDRIFAPFHNVPRFHQ